MTKLEGRPTAWIENLRARGRCYPHCHFKNEKGGGGRRPSICWALSMSYLADQLRELSARLNDTAYRRGRLRALPATEEADVEAYIALRADNDPQRRRYACFVSRKTERFVTRDASASAGNVDHGDTAIANFDVHVAKIRKKFAQTLPLAYQSKQNPVSGLCSRQKRSVTSTRSDIEFLHCSPDRTPNSSRMFFKH